MQRLRRPERPIKDRAVIRARAGDNVIPMHGLFDGGYSNRGPGRTSGFDSQGGLHLKCHGNAGHSFIRLQPVSMVVGISHNDDFVGSCFTHQLFEACLNRGLRPYNRGTQPAFYRGPLDVLPQPLHGIHRRQQLHRLVSDQIAEIVAGAW